MLLLIFRVIPILIGICLLLISPLYLYYHLYLHRKIQQLWLDPLAEPSLWTSFWYLILVLIPPALFLYNFAQFNVKVRSSEAKVGLHGIYTAQQSYYVKHQNYAGGDQVFNLIGWEPAGQNRYAYYCDQGVIWSKYPTNGLPLSKENWPLTISPQSTSTGFFCFAAGNLDFDPFLDVWMINEQNQLEQVQDDRSDGICKDIYKPWSNLPWPIRNLRLLLSCHREDLYCAAAWITLFLLVRGFYRDEKRFAAAMAVSRQSNSVVSRS